MHWVLREASYVLFFVILRLVTWCQEWDSSDKMPDETPGTPSTSAGAERSISQLKPTGNLDFGNPSECPHAWKWWKEEITLYMDLAMDGREEKTKVKLFLYTIGNQGLEIYDTLPFSRGPTERSLKDVIDAFETHWNPKKNETVERYRFFTRVQEEGEPLEKFIVDLKILTCNFSTLRESLVRDRIICGIRDSKLREDLLKVADLDLDKCVNACRASNYRKKGTEELRQRQKQSTISLAETKEKRKKTKEIRAAEKRCEPEINPKMQILWTTTSAKKLPSIRCRMSEVPQIKSFRFRLHV